MLKAIIIDDEHLARELVGEYLEAHPHIQVVDTAGDGFEAFRKITEHKPDLIFLDIQMPKINGFELLEILPEKPQVIFTTAFDEYAVKAFESQALDYLLKPFSQSRFDQSISKLSATKNAENSSVENLDLTLNRQPDEHKRVVVKNGAEIQIIPTSDIDFIEAYDDYVKIYVGNQYHLKKKTLTYYEKQLDSDQFMRIHRSFILNISKLTRIESFEKNSQLAILTSGKRIPISRTSYPVLKLRLGI